MKPRNQSGLPDRQFPVDEAAKSLGLDSFTLYALIQRQQVKVDAMPWGEIVLPRSELQRLLKRPTGARP
jgi:hypothetical protein